MLDLQGYRPARAQRPSEIGAQIMEGFERPPTRRGASRGGRMQRAPPARSAGANLSAEDLQRRRLAIGNAAKARNPDGFVDELKRRVASAGARSPP